MESAQRRRGRPQRLPFDPTPLHLPTVNGEFRMGWLLATTRLLSRSTMHTGRGDFMDRLRLLDIAVDAPKLSRWESGTVAAPPHLLNAYEHVVGLPPGLLLSAHLMLRRMTDAGGFNVDPATPETDDRLDDIFDRIESGGASGADWLALVTEVMRFERVYLRPDSWAVLCGRLVNELTRSGGVAFVRRYEAAALLMKHPTARGHLTRSLGAFVLNPDVQNAAPALALLGEAGDDAVGTLVMRLVGERNPLLRKGSIGVLAAMAARGHLPTDSARMVEALARSELHTGGLSRRVTGFELTTHLPADGYERVMAALPDERMRKQLALARTTMELVPADVARSVAEGVASHAEAELERAAHDPDQMLRKLIREGLFHTARQRRNLAATLLGISPYGRPVAHSLLRLTSDADPLTAAMGWSMLRRMSQGLDRSELVAPACGAPAELQPRALVTLGLGSGPLADEAADELLRLATTASQYPVRQTAVFALGMVGHEHVRTLNNDRASELSASASWWLEIGSALHDDA